MSQEETKKAAVDKVGENASKIEVEELDELDLEKVAGGIKALEKDVEINFSKCRCGTQAGEVSR